MPRSSLLQRVDRYHAMAHSILERSRGAAPGALEAAMPRRFYPARVDSDDFGVASGTPWADASDTSAAPFAPPLPFPDLSSAQAPPLVAPSAGAAAVGPTGFTPAATERTVESATLAPITLPADHVAVAPESPLAASAGRSLVAPALVSEPITAEPAHTPLSPPARPSAAQSDVLQAPPIPMLAGTSAQTVSAMEPVTVRDRPSASASTQSPQTTVTPSAQQTLPVERASTADPSGSTATLLPALSVEPAAAPAPTAGGNAQASTTGSTASGDRSPAAWAARLFGGARSAALSSPDTPSTSSLAAVQPSPTAAATTRPSFSPTPPDPPDLRSAAPAAASAEVDPAQVRPLPGDRSPAAWARRLFGAEAAATRDTPTAAAPSIPGAVAPASQLQPPATHLGARRTFVPARLAAAPSVVPRAGVPSDAVTGFVPPPVLTQADASPRRTPSAPAAPAAPFAPSADTALGASPHRIPSAPAAPAAAPGFDQFEQPTNSSGPRSWNGLPAPWEPLAGLEAAPPQAGSAASPASVQRAARPALAPVPAHAAADTGAQAPTLDLDDLTERVYTQLRRRISAERRLYDLD